MEQIIRCYKPEGKVEDITTPLYYEELRERVGGYLEVHNVGAVTIVCDEDGRLKGLPFCRNFCGSNFVGTVYVGEFTDAGLEPVSKAHIEEFESKYMFPV